MRFDHIVQSARTKNGTSPDELWRHSVGEAAGGQVRSTLQLRNTVASMGGCSL